MLHVVFVYPPPQQQQQQPLQKTIGEELYEVHVRRASFDIDEDEERKEEDEGCDNEGKAGDISRRETTDDSILTAPLTDLCPPSPSRKRKGGGDPPIEDTETFEKVSKTYVYIWGGGVRIIPARRDLAEFVGSLTLPSYFLFKITINCLAHDTEWPRQGTTTEQKFNL